MVILNNTSLETNSTTSPVPQNTALAKVKKHLERLQKNGSKGIKNTGGKDSNKTIAYPNSQANRVHSSSSSLSDERHCLLKRTTMQEKLFAYQCQRSKNLDSGTSSSTSKSPSQEIVKISEFPNSMSNRYPKEETNFQNGKSKQLHRRQIYDSSDDSSSDSDDIQYSESKNEIDESKNEIGLLHLKAPVINEKNLVTYYHNRGRMEPIDWSSITGGDQRNSNDDQSTIKNNDKESVNQSEKVSIDKPDANIHSKEFLNFVYNSTTSDTIFTVGSNLVSNSQPMESPILKIQRMISKNNSNNNNNNNKICYLTQDVKKMFKSNLQESDSTVKLTTIDSDQLKSCKVVQQKDNRKIIENNHTKQTVSNTINECESMYCFDSKDTLSTLPSLNSGTKKSITDYTDDMFNFQSPTKLIASTPSNSMINNASSINSLESSCNHTTESVRSSTSLASANLDKSLISTIKSSFTDSDDISTKNSISNISSSSKKSTSKFECMKSKLISSKELNVIKPQMNNKCEIKTHTGELLLRETSTKYFKQATNKNTESDSVKVKSNDDFLLKPVSTKYFKKPSLNQVQDKNNKQCLNDDKIQGISNKICDAYEKEVEKHVENITCSSSNSDHIVSDTDNLSEPSYSKLLIEEIPFDSAEIKLETSSEKQLEIIDATPSIEEELKCKTLSPITLSSQNLSQFDNIDSGEEFDIVNVEEFLPFRKMVDSIKNVQNALVNQINSVDESGTDDITINNMSSIKSIESSFNISEDDNQCSNISASISSNLDSDSDTASSKSMNLLTDKKNIYQNLNLNNSEWEKGIHAYYSMQGINNPTAVTIQNKSNTNNVDTSKRKKRMMDALKNHKKNLNGIVSNEHSTD